MSAPFLTLKLPEKSISSLTGTIVIVARGNQTIENIAPPISNNKSTMYNNGPNHFFPVF